MLCLPSLDRGRILLGSRQVLGAGLVAAVSYHIRTDLGLVVLVATLTVHALSRGPGWPARFFN